MLTITRTTFSASMAAADVRDIPARVITYAAATALTRSVIAGKKAVVEQMPRVFNNPTRYTLNALRTENATKDKLSARIAVKDQASSGTRPESYLLPEVDGGGRSEKRFERALRYSGLLPRGMQAMPAQDISLDAAGNVSSREISRILSLLKRVRAKTATRSKYGNKRLGKGRALANELFVGHPVNGRGANARPRPGAPDGIYRREGKRLRKLFIFTKPASYRQRLDFEGIVYPVVRDRFQAEFELAAEALLRKRR